MVGLGEGIWGLKRGDFNHEWGGRNSGCCAPSGLGMFFIVETRAMPWPITFCPFGASEADQRINCRTRGGGCLVAGVSERGWAGCWGGVDYRAQ